MNRSIIVLVIFFLYELIALKLNLYSISLHLLSFLSLKSDTSSQTHQYSEIIRSIIQNNPLYNSQILNHIQSVEIIGVSDVISYSNEYFYISTLKDLKPLDIVLNEHNFLGIVEKVTPRISRVRYLNSNSFQIPAKVIYTNHEIFGFIKTSSKIYFYPFNNTSNIEIYSHVVTMGYFHIPPGIPIGEIYNNNEVKIFKDIKKTNQVIVIRRKR
ncbi:MAG: rod shape-determining protein MreC [Candidatus Calescibacterium sp.]|nr:hypothetical protein [Candidatus Calescibacterium sp.]MCX7971780.1 hypothetical protein [bacterium]MDW8195386.1 rod shape-determining protein MreC [Candidatus Calescibacterium sp.]